MLGGLTPCCEVALDGVEETAAEVAAIRDMFNPTRKQVAPPLIEIDRYGQRWIGCVNCNRWGKPGDKRLVMELSEEDLAALEEWTKQI